MEVSEGESGFLPELELESSPSPDDVTTGPSSPWLDSREGIPPFMSWCLQMSKVFCKLWNLKFWHWYLFYYSMLTFHIVIINR